MKVAATAITTIPSKRLNLQGVRMPAQIFINGKLTGAIDEVIVIEQRLRQIFKEAYVCHITEGPFGRGIYDMPDITFIRDGGAVYLRRIGDINFTMMCETEHPKYFRTNWLA